MAHALRYFCSWETEVYKHQMRLELWEKDYEGEATAMVLSGEPQLTMEEGDTICGSSLDFGLLSETNGQYLHLYTTDNHKYLIKILRDSAVMWEGYLLPEYYSEAYIAAPYTVSFTATDWLGMLKNIDFPAEDTRVPILQIIKTCLQYTELPLDFACQLDLRVEGINDTTNVLGALYLNPITFTGYNCYEVLEKILAAFNATLRQMGHRWLISSIDDDVPLRLISWNSLSYTGNGESNNGEVIGTNFAGTFIDGSLSMVISPAKKSVDLSQDIFYRESWLKDYDFHSADAWTWPANTSVVKPGLAYYIKDGVLLEQISVDYFITRRIDSHELLYLSQVINVEGAPDDSEYTLGIKFFTPNLVNGDNRTALWVKIINRSSTSLTQDVAYLSKDGWTNEESYIELNGTSAEPKYISTHTYNRGGRQYLIYDKENWPITKINFISIPYTGKLEIRIEPWYTTCFGGVYLTKTNITKNLTISSSLNPDAAETASSVNLMLCDSPEERNVELGVLNYFSLSDGALTTGKKWYYNGQEYEDFLHAIAYSYSRCYANKRQKLSGALYTDKIYNLCSFTDKWSGKRHTIKSWIYSIISERLDSMEIIETPAKEIELTLSTPEAGSSNKQNQPSGGTSGGGATSMAGSGRYVNLDTAQEVSGEKTWNDKATFKKDIVVEGDGIFGGEVSGIVGEGTPAGVTDYSALTGKPSINGKELVSGNNTLDALGIQPKGDYTTASQLATTLENYATKVFVSNNYASKGVVNAIQALIPATATADNQLADKDFVNSSIATATAEFRGSFTSLDELKATSGNLNDYAFYLHTDSIGNSIVDRYKWTTAGWLYEYTLNNSSFTAEQWAALNSAITATLVQSYNSHLTNTTIHITAAERTAWNNKWDYDEATIKAVKVNAAGSADYASNAATATNAGNADTLNGYHASSFYKHAAAFPSGNSEKTWHKIATFSQSTVGLQINTSITFYVSEFFYTKSYGIFTVRARAEEDSTSPSFLTVDFLVNAGISKSDIVATWKHTDDGNIVINVYAYRAGWSSFSFRKIEEQAWGSPQDKWTTLNAIQGNENCYSSIPSDENQVVSTNIDINNNVASATKLQDNIAFTAWDQTFFENGKPKNVSGDLNVGVSKLYWNWDSVNYYMSCGGTEQMTYNMYGGHIFRAGGYERMRICANGNVLIGTTTDNGYKLDVNGKGHYSGDLICGGEVVAVAGEGTPAGVTDYSALTGKPAINGVTLVSGNNTLVSLGIQAAGDYATNSGVTTLLANYADKTFVSNNYAGKAAFNNHTADTDIHITASERVAWNAKWDYDEATIKAVKVTSASSADSVAWSGISGKPTTFTPSAHTHTASEVSGLPTSLKNPFALTFGSKTYDGSAAATITASDLGALTAHQTIYALTLQVNSVSQGTYNPASAAKTINIAVPTKTSDITNDSGFITSTSIPTALKNPYAVEIKANGVSLGTYDGSAAATFNLSAANVGAANKVHSHAASEISGLPTNLSAFTNDVGYLTSITKSMVEGVLTGDITSHTHTFASITSKPTTIAGYGITDAYTATTIDSKLSGYLPLSGGTMMGSIKFNDNSLPSKTLSYICGIDAFANGGEMGWMRGSDFVAQYAPTLTGTGASGTWGISISGNAASATKLQDNTAFTAWDQTFFENGKPKNVSGDLNVGVSKLYWNWDTVNYYMSCGGTEQMTYNMHGGHIFRAGGAERMRISANGNILIGTSTDNGYKLQVGGSERVYGDLIVDGEVSALVA